MIEDMIESWAKGTVKVENVRQRGNWLKTFLHAQLKMSLYSKKLLAIYMAFLEFERILWEATKPTMVLTDNKSVTRFFETKAIPPALWNAFDCLAI